MSDTDASHAILEEIIPGSVNLVRSKVSRPKNLQTTCDMMFEVFYFGSVMVLISSSVNSRFSVRVFHLYQSVFKNCVGS